MIRILLILAIPGAAAQVGRAAINLADARDAARVAIIQQAEGSK